MNYYANESTIERYELERLQETWQTMIKGAKKELEIMKREKSLDRLTQIHQEMGLYEFEEESFEKYRG